MRLITTTLILTIICNIYAQNSVYQEKDSVKIESILNNSGGCYDTTGELVLAVANEFMGTPYVAGTLEREDGERLIVNTREMDCTTFMEQVTAIILTHKQNRTTFHAFCDNLEKIRYRNGVCNGYTSRLHYISQWITDSFKENIIEEIITDAHTATQSLNLNFMSRHPQYYHQLKTDSCLRTAIEEQEKPFRNIEIKYIPKSALNGSPHNLGIENGDILALVTAIEGLDVSHIGFAKWIQGRLHLVHASSGKKVVLTDEKTLYDYQKSKQSHLGVRVFRIK